MAKKSLSEEISRPIRSKHDDDSHKSDDEGKWGDSMAIIVIIIVWSSSRQVYTLLSLSPPPHIKALEMSCSLNTHLAMRHRTNHNDNGFISRYKVTGVHELLGREGGTQLPAADWEVVCHRVTDGLKKLHVAIGGTDTHLVEQLNWKANEKNDFFYIANSLVLFLHRPPSSSPLVHTFQSL